MLVVFVQRIECYGRLWKAWKGCWARVRAAPERGGDGEGAGRGRAGGRCLPLRHFRSFALLEEAFPLAGAGYGSDGV